MSNKTQSGKSSSLMESFCSKDTTLDHNVKRAELKLVGFLAEHNISFLSMDHLQGVLKECFPDSNIAKNIHLHRTKATAMATNVLGKQERININLVLKQVKFSIVIDESTDISTCKNLCIIVRFYDSRNNKIVSKFFGTYHKYFQDNIKLLLGNAGNNGENNCKPDYNRSKLLGHWLVKDK
jgi:hypothetical protein